MEKCMSKLYLRYGTVDSSKTARLLMDAHDYKRREENPLLIKSALDTRSAKGMIESRTGLSAPCVDIDKDDNIVHIVNELIEGHLRPVVILIDEAQFLTYQQVIHLRIIADQYNIPVMCYGLKVDFMGNLFEGSKALFEHANVLEEVKTMCREKGCTAKAMYNGRFKDGKPVFNGEVVVIGDTKEDVDDYYYIPKCSKHFFNDFNEYNKTRGV